MSNEFIISRTQNNINSANNSPQHLNENISRHSINSNPNNEIKLVESPCCSLSKSKENINYSYNDNLENKENLDNNHIRAVKRSNSSVLGNPFFTKNSNIFELKPKKRY